MTQIKKGRIKMKPKIHFILGTLALFAAIVGTIILLLFTMSVLSFSFRTLRPMTGLFKLHLIFKFIPWWAPLLVIFGVLGSVYLLKKFDFSYKKNFTLIIVLFILSLILIGWLLDYSGLDRLLFNRGPMRRFYQQRMIDKRFVPTPIPKVKGVFKRFRFR